MRSKVVFVVCFSVSVLCSQAAQIYTEAFTNGPVGWTNGTIGQLVASNSHLYLNMSSQGIPVPETGHFYASNSASGGAFVGNYATANVGVIGFDFCSLQVVPELILAWKAGSSRGFRTVTADYPMQPGVVYSVAISLASRSEGKWQGVTDADFLNLMTNVINLDIQITRRGTAAQSYYIDNVFVDYLPYASSTRVISNSTDQTVWTALREGFTNTLQTTHVLDNTWSNVLIQVATGRTASFSAQIPTNGVKAFYRIAQPEVMIKP